MNKPNLITQLFDVGCIKFGDFTMVSGLSSPIYIDLRLIMAQPTLLKQVALSYSGLIHNLVFDHLAAVPYAALPIGTALSLQINKPLIYPRKEVKKHGAKQAVEGVFSPLDKAIIIEDLVTKGGSVLGAIQILEEAGFKQIRFIEWIKTNPVPLNSSRNYLTNAREVALLGVKTSRPC